MFLVRLFVLYMLVLSFLSSSWCRVLAAVCDCGTPWTFLLTFFNSSTFLLQFGGKIKTYRICKCPEILVIFRLHKANTLISDDYQVLVLYLVRI